MSEKDERLIRQAKAYSATQYDEVLALRDQAESEEARAWMHNRACYLYHIEEARHQMI